MFSYTQRNLIIKQDKLDGKIINVTCGLKPLAAQIAMYMPGAQKPQARIQVFAVELVFSIVYKPEVTLTELYA